jgi:hypothetical protein
LREIENERSSLDIPPSSKVRPLSRVLQESKEFLYTTDRDNTKESHSNKFGSNRNIGKNYEIVVEDTVQSSSLTNVTTSDSLITSREKSVCVPQQAKATYITVNITPNLNGPSPTAQTINAPSHVVPPAPPIRTVSSRQPSPALSHGGDRKKSQECGKGMPSTAAAALLDEIRNSVISPTPLLASPDNNPVHDTRKTSNVALLPCKDEKCEETPLKAIPLANGGRKLSARQNLSKTSLKIIPDCKHP